MKWKDTLYGQFGCIGLVNISVMIPSHAEPFRDPTLLAPELGQPQIPRNQLVTSGSSALPSASRSRGVGALLELCSSFQGTGIQFPPPPGLEQRGKCVQHWLGTCNLTPSPMSLLGIEVTEPLSSVTGVPRIVEAEKAPGLIYGLRKAVCRPAGRPRPGHQNKPPLLPPSVGGVEWSGA